MDDSQESGGLWAPQYWIPNPVVKHFQVLEKLECYLGLARIDNSQESVLCNLQYWIFHPIVANFQVLSDPVDTLSS